MRPSTSYTTGRTVPYPAVHLNRLSLRTSLAVTLNFGHSYAAAEEMTFDFSNFKRGPSIANSTFSSISRLNTVI